MGSGPRQTTCSGSISDRNVGDGKPGKGPVSAPDCVRGARHFFNPSPLPCAGSATFSSVRYPAPHLIFKFVAEDQPTRR